MEVGDFVREYAFDGDPGVAVERRGREVDDESGDAEAAVADGGEGVAEMDGDALGVTAASDRAPRDGADRGTGQQAPLFVAAVHFVGEATHQ